MKRIIKFLKRHKYPFLFDKRQRFALQTFVLTAGLLITQLIWEDYRFLMVGVLAILSYILTAWSLFEDIKGIEWILLFILPTLFTATVSLFYFLLPGRWITRLTIATVFALGTYANLLVENIYNVAVARSIQLIRAAQSVGLLISLVVVFLSTSLVFSLRVYPWLNMLILASISFLLGLQSFWSVKLEENLSCKIFLYAFIVSWGIGELVFVISFWPIQLATASLFITSSFYALVGIVQQYLSDRLFRNTIREYILVFLFTLVLIFLTTKWG